MCSNDLFPHSLGLNVNSSPRTPFSPIAKQWLKITKGVVSANSFWDRETKSLWLRAAGPGVPSTGRVSARDSSIATVPQLPLNQIHKVVSKIFQRNTLELTTSCLHHQPTSAFQSLRGWIIHPEAHSNTRSDHPHRVKGSRLQNPVRPTAHEEHTWNPSWYVTGSQLGPFKDWWWLVTRGTRLVAPGLHDPTNLQQTLLRHY